MIKRPRVQDSEDHAYEENICLELYPLSLAGKC